jgi:hypothetical protein
MHGTKVVQVQEEKATENELSRAQIMKLLIMQFSAAQSYH